MLRIGNEVEAVECLVGERVGSKFDWLIPSALVDVYHPFILSIHSKVATTSFFPSTSAGHSPEGLVVALPSGLIKLKSSTLVSSLSSSFSSFQFFSSLFFSFPKSLMASARAAGKTSFKTE
ncbi:hypothetical protein L1987_45886 [Smallanthus sonchifolius]|uniref:Uncharacterized protein n=1 Tax=Smallanthus sonchifolius TaxID=185202 RepID=A0ACB9FY40_9ASTR|nr:hypothetical protein L1987_45886 [Smallanthus sonchifolius]